MGWVFYVAVVTTVYGVFFNAKFARGGELPPWLIKDYLPEVIQKLDDKFMVYEVSKK